MTSLKDGDLQHSSALAQSPKGDIEPNHPSEINPNSDSRSRSDGRSRRYVQYRVDQSLSSDREYMIYMIYMIYEHILRKIKFLSKNSNVLKLRMQLFHYVINQLAQVKKEYLRNEYKINPGNTKEGSI